MDTYVQASQYDQKSAAALGLPLLCVWSLMLFTIGHPEDEALRPLLPAQLLSYSKLLLRLSVLALSGVMLLGLRSHPRHRTAIWVMLPFWMFASWAVLSTVWSPLRTITLGQALGQLTLIALASVLAVKWNGQRATSAVLHCLTLGAGSCSILLLLCYFLLPDVGAMTRDQSGLLHSTGAGATASLGLIIITAARLFWGWTWARRLWLPASLAYVAVLVISTNRLALVLAFGLTSLLIAAFANRTLLTAGTVALCVLATAYLTLDPGLQLTEQGLEALTAYSQRDQSDAELSTLSGRHEMWEVMWASFAESPWIGHGYFVTSRTGSVFVWYRWGNWTAHSVYLQLLVTTGIIGCAILGWGGLRIGYLLVAGFFAGRIDWRVLAFLFIVAAWFLCWGLLNESVAGPLQPESVVFYVCIGIGAGAIGSASLRTCESIHHGPQPTGQLR